MKSFRCQEHPARYYTNYCGAAPCLTALCPECLPAHLRKKRCDSTFLEPIEAVYQRAQLNGDRCYRQLTEQVSLMKERQSRLVSDSHQRNQLALKEYRQKIQLLVKRHFEFLEAKMKALEAQVSNDQRLMRTISKYDNFRGEVGRMMKDLNSCVNLNQALRTLVGLDLRSFAQNIKAQTQYVAAEVKPPLLHIDTQFMQQLTTCLDRGINFKENVTMLADPVLVDAQPNAALNFSINSEDAGQQQPNLIQSSFPISEAPGQRHTIRAEQYFSSDCQFNLLHSFEPLTKNIYIVPLEILNEDEKMHIHRSQLNTHELSKVGARSLITPRGEIFVFGGRNPSLVGSEASIKKLLFDRNELVEVGTMKHARQNHCVCYCQGYVYILNGEAQPGSLLRDCEQYNVRTGAVQEIAPSKLAVTRAAACQFNSQYIFRFSGQDERGLLVQAIERYDIRRNTWDIINPIFNMSIPPNVLTRFSWKPECLALQINPQEILLSCGSTEDQYSTGTAVLAVEPDGSFEVSSIRLRNLPTSGFFGQPIIYNQIVHCIQVHPSKPMYNILLSDANQWTVLN